MISLENFTVGDLMQRTVNRFPYRKAIWYEGKSWNYTQLNEITDQMAVALLGLGVCKGDYVGIWGEIEPESVFLFYAIQKLGAIAVMLNTSLEKEELTQALRLSEVKYLCVGTFYKHTSPFGVLPQILPELPLLREVISIQSEPMPSFRSLRQFMNLPNRVLCSVLPRMCAAVDPQDTAVILFTSGSTSQPKAVMSSHYSRVNSGIQQAKDLHANCDDLFCVAMPMFHCFCISVNLMATLSSGACLCIPKDRHTVSILHTIKACKCTVLSSVPTMYHAMLSRPDFQPEDVTSLRTGIIGGAHYPAEEFVTIEKALGITLLSSLGQTECTAGLTVCNREDSIEVRSHTVGHFMDHVEGKIADLQTGEALLPGQRGEICVRGYVKMQGYYGRPDLTAQTIDKDGWLHTGDLGVLDAKGNITLAGRIKELIIRGGENISPCEIEVALSELPQVKCCKAVGVPDAHYGEEICACICVNEGQSLDETTVRNHLSKHLAYYKIPRYILFWNSFPCTATGKIKPLETAWAARKELHLQ